MSAIFLGLSDFLYLKYLTDTLWRFFNCETDKCLMHLKSWPWNVSQVISVSISLIWMDESINTLYGVLSEKIQNKDLSWSKSENVYTSTKLKYYACVIRRFPRRPPGNGESDASIAFWLQKGHSAGKPLPQLAIREDTFFVQNCTKKLIFFQ